MTLPPGADPLLAAARASRDAAVAQWADTAGGGSLCRVGGATDRRALKRAEGASTALRQLVRALDQGERDPDAAADILDRHRQRWDDLSERARGDDWRAYADGGRAALAALPSGLDADGSA